MWEAIFFGAKVLEKNLIKKYWWAILVGNLLAVTLGFTSTILFTILGPSIQIYINSSSGAQISLSSLLGEHYASFIKIYFAVETLPHSYLISILPITIFTLASIRGFLTIFQWYLWELVSERIVKDIRSSIVSSSSDKAR